MITSPWTKAIGDYLTHLAAGGSPKTTMATRRSHLYRCARDVGVDPWTIKYDELEAWIGAQEWAQESRRGMRTTLRSFWSWGVNSGRAVDDIAGRLPKVRASDPNPQPVPERHYLRAIDMAGPRERLMLRMAKELGMRRAEIATAHSRWLFEDLEGWSLRVVGKGNKVREIPMPSSLATELLSLPDGWVFPGNDHGHLSPRWVGTLVAKLLPGAWTCHKLRHSAATEWYDLDKDVFTVQDLLGHASPATTRRYVRIKNNNLRRTVEAAA